MNYGTNAGAGRIEKERIVDECDRAAQVVGAAKLGGGRPTLDQINGRLQQFIMSMSDQLEKTFAERMQRLAFAAGRNCTLA